MVKEVILQCYVYAILIFLLRRCPGFVTSFGFGFLYLIIMSIVYYLLRKR